MSLSQAASYLRSLIKWGVILLAALVVFRILFGIGVFYYNQIFPAPPPGPQLAFGNLVSIKIPGNSVNLTETKVILDTIEATPPATPKVLNVYKATQPTAQLLNLDEAKRTAAALGFKNEPRSLSSTHYQWVDPQNNNRILNMDIINGNFKLKYNYQTDSSFNKLPFNLTKEAVLADVKTTLRGAGSLPEDLDKGESRVTLIKIAESVYTKANSPSEADGIMVELFRTKIEDKYALVQKDPDLAYVNAVVIPGPADKKFIELNYTYWPINLKESSTYPIVPSLTIWESFLKGNGVVIEGGDVKIDTLRITDINLAYWESPEYQDFFQPIYVFSGFGNTNNNPKEKIPYKVYLPAIDSKYIVQ